MYLWTSKRTKSRKGIKEERQKPKEKKWKLFSLETRRHKMRIFLFFSFSLSQWLLFRVALEMVTETIGDGEHKLCNQQFKAIKSTSVLRQPSIEKSDQTWVLISTPASTGSIFEQVKLSKVFPGGSGSKESTCNAGDLGSIPGSQRSPGGGYGNPLQYSFLENSKDRVVWWATVHGVAKSWTWQSD